MTIHSDFGFTMRPSRRELLLVAAEDGATRAALVARLQEDGYSVLSAASAEDALATLGVTRAALIVSALRDGQALRDAGPPVIHVTEVDSVSDAVSSALGKQR